MSIQDYRDLAEITPKTVPWEDFYREPHEGEDEHKKLAIKEYCPRCGGQGGSPHWYVDGGICFQCRGVNSTWTRHTTVAEERRRAKKRAQHEAGVVRKKLREARALEERKAEQYAGYPVMHLFTPRGIDDLCEHLTDKAVGILDDMVSRAAKWELSEKQVAFAAKLLTEGLYKAQRAEALEAGWKDPAEEEKPECPEGRYEISGEVTSIKHYENEYSYHGGIDYKMVVSDDRGFRVFCTIPRDVIDELHDRGLTSEDLKGCRITFTATVKRSEKDKDFGKGKIPKRVSVEYPAHAEGYEPVEEEEEAAAV